MGGFAFRCPNTGFHVQAWSDDDSDSPEFYETVSCTACKRMHLVNPTTGRVLGEENEKE